MVDPCQVFPVTRLPPTERELHCIFWKIKVWEDTITDVYVCAVEWRAWPLSQHLQRGPKRTLRHFTKQLSVTLSAIFIHILFKSKHTGQTTCGGRVINAH